MNLTQAFAAYRAKLQNARWAVSAISDDGELVVSCWMHLFEPPEAGILRYRDKLSRWSEGNPNGASLCQEHLQGAFDTGLRVRLVIAATDDEEAVAAGSASKPRTTFYLKKTHVGKVVEFDGDRMVIDFQKDK